MAKRAGRVSGEIPHCKKGDENTDLQSVSWNYCYLKTTPHFCT